MNDRERGDAEDKTRDKNSKHKQELMKSCIREIDIVDESFSQRASLLMPVYT